MLISRKSPTASNFKVPIVNLTLRILSEGKDAARTSLGTKIYKDLQSIKP